MSFPAYPKYRDSGAAWLGMVPDSWRVLQVKRRFRVTVGKMLNAGTASAEGESVPYLRAGNVQPNGLDLAQVKHIRLTATERKALDLRRGDLVVVEGGAGYGRSAFLNADLPGWAFQNHILRVRSTNGDSTEYLGYVVQTLNALGHIASLSNHATIPSLSSEQLARIQVPLPDVDTQRAILAFLDRQTAKIDALIGKQEQLIATLREDRDAVWSEFFDEAADGLKPVKLRRAVTSIADGPFGSSLTSAHYADEGVRVIRLGNLGINEFKDSDRAYISTAYARELSAHQVVAGDVIIAGLGDERMPLGRAVVVPDIGPAINKADCFRVRPRPGLSAEFLAWAMSAPQTRTQMALLARGATRARLNTSVVGEALIPMPDIEVQRRTVVESGGKFAKIDALICKAEQVIGTLQEYRSALITDAVTGKIDVRGVA